MRREILQRLNKPDPKGNFATTHWSLIRRAADSDDPRAIDALGALCSLYWPPLYHYLRRLGYSPDSARDLVQGCFARLLASPGWLQVSPQRGRFRSWLLTALQHHLADQRDRSLAQRRGAGVPPISIDASEEEGRLMSLASQERTPEQEFDRRWALTLLDRVLGALASEYSEPPHRARLFDLLRGVLPGAGESQPYAVVAHELGMMEGAVKVAAHRLRQRYRELLRAEVACLVDSPDDVDEELRHLIAAVGIG